jgi:TolB-like protein
MLVLNTLTTIYCSVIFILGCSSTREVQSKPEIIKSTTTNNQIEQDKSLDEALDDLTNQIVNSLSEQKKTRIAVLEFLDLQGNKTNLGRFIAEELITRLYMTQKFFVIERQLLNKVLEEHKLTSTGLIDESSAKELGKILGVDAIASGTITDLTNSVKLNSRLFSTETGAIFSVASVDIPKDEDVKKLIGFTTTTPTKELNEESTKRQLTGNTFYKEDFSNVKDGYIPSNWVGGEKLMVKTGNRGKYLADFEKQKNHKVTINNVNFPENFELVYTFQFGSHAGSTHVFLYLGGIKAVIDIYGWATLNNSKYGGKFDHRNKVVVAALQKEGNLYKLIINGEEVITARYDGMKILNSFSLEFQNMYDFKLLSIEGKTI